jgi:hypothetical protein
MSPADAKRRAALIAALAALSAAAGGIGVPSPAHAQGTIAYYRFEEGAQGTKVPVTADEDAPAGSPVLDYSGNGNNLKTFADASAPTYSANVPAGTVPQTGAGNFRSLGFTPNQDVYSLNAVGGGPGGGTLNDHAFPAFTIEASVNFSSLDGFQTFVGRDRPGETLGFFYLRKWGSLDADDPNTNALNVTVVADDGTTFDLFSTGTGASDTFSTVSTDVWYNVVAQSDGSMLRLLVQNNGTGIYELQGSIPITTALSNTGATNFTIGRGWFNSPTDFVDGYVDEVRISDTALAPSQLLFASRAAIPEPGTLALLGSGLLALTGALVRRRRRAA